MVNNCQVIIKNGQNAGRKCCEVAKWCKHVGSSTSCVCGFTTEYKSSLSRHKKKCEIAQQHMHEMSEELNGLGALSCKCGFVTKYNSSLSRHRKTCKMTHEREDSTAHLSDPVVNKLAKKIESLETEVATLKKKESGTTIINNGVVNFNNTNYNIAVMASNFFEAMKEKKGESKAISTIVGATERARPLEILKELYFKGDPNEYPIASRNGRYRYLNEEGQLVETGATRMGKMLSTRLQNAMSYAASMLIRTTKAVDKLYDFYDIGRIQTNICYFPREMVETDLSTVTENPTHPFFMDGVIVICLE